MRVGAPRVAAFDGTTWTDQTPSNSLFLFILPREFHVLPTFGGAWVISDGLAGFIIASVPGETPFGWDPSIGEWSGVGASASGAFTFESAAGLFPVGTYRYDPVTGAHERWEVGFGELIRGDVDGNGSVNLVDAIQMLGFLFGDEILDCYEAGDANEDGSLNVSDAIHLLGFLFSPSGVATLFPPYPQCGPDLDLDNLDCANHEFCP